MSIFDVFRRKKKEEAEFGSTETNAHTFPEGDFEPLPQENLQPNFPQFQPDQLQQGISSRDIELILTKLELINNKLIDMDRRLRFIEKVAKESK